MRITRFVKLSFININFVNEVKCDVAPLDACDVMFGSPYLWDRDALFYKRENKYCLVKGGGTYFIKAHKGKNQASLVASGLGKKLIGDSQKKSTFKQDVEEDLEKRLGAMCFHLLHN
jgi:hypothetical protein